MQRIALLSDTHNYLDEKIFKYFETCDQIWHAGDIGSIAIMDELRKIKPVIAVYGNIDGQDVRSVYKKNERWMCEKVDVLMTHIGGYPDKYEKGKVITGEENVSESLVFHAGTAIHAETGKIIRTEYE